MSASSENITIDIDNVTIQPSPIQPLLFENSYLIDVVMGGGGNGDKRNLVSGSKHTCNDNSFSRFFGWLWWCIKPRV